jgi:hypothetical protein
MVLKRDSKKIGVILCTFVVLALVMLTSIRVYAQVSGATLEGTVTDASGAVISNARVSIQNTGTGEVRDVTANSTGFYSAPNLLPGSYEITVSAPGFSTGIRSGITLTVGAQQVLNMQMKVGQVSEKIEVTSEATTVQLVNSTISGDVSQATVVNLPLNGRDWTELATLQPGVISVRSIQANTAANDRANRGYGAQLAISGTRPAANNYRIDGINVNDYTGGGPGSVAGATLGVDAVQEFSVLTSNYSAEYGRTSGGVINSITKSGTNQFHGDAYEFLRNSALDARNYFDPPTIPEFRRNEFGGSVGAPIVKGHTFFFADYEGLRESQGITTLINVPSQAVHNGTLCSIPQPGVCSTHQVTGAFNPDPATGIDKAVLPYLALWPLPNEGLLGNGDTGIYQFNGGHVTTENFGTGRVDHKFSDKDSLFGNYKYDGATLTQPNGGNTVINGHITGSMLVAIEETHIFNSQLLNSARVGYNRSTHSDYGINAVIPLAANPSLGDSPGQDNPAIDIPGVNSIPAGLNGLKDIQRVLNSFQGYDDVFLTKGIHGLKFGFAVERIQDNNFTPDPSGDFPFNSLLDFLTNQPTSYFKSLPTLPFPHFAFRSTLFGGYVQDDIRVRSNLTVNLGLRYEMSTIPTEAHGHFVLMSSPTASVASSSIRSNLFLTNPTLRNFEPRVGFAWDPFRNGKTSVRGGFGMFDVLPLPFLLENYLGTVPWGPAAGTINLLPAGSFPTGAFTLLSTQLVGGIGLEGQYWDPNHKRNYVMQWNLNIQRELMPTLTAMVAYVGQHGVHQEFRADNINIPQPALTPAGYLWPMTPGTNFLNPTAGTIDSAEWSNGNSYNALQAQLVKRMSHGFQVQGSYTWSKAIDQGTGVANGDPFLNSIFLLFWFAPKYRRGPADFNIAQNLVANFIWNIPTPSSFHGPAASAARGWQLGGILQARSGLPFTPLIGGDPLGFTVKSIAYPDRLSGSGCQSVVNPGNVNNYIKLQCFALPVATPAIAAQCVPFQPGGPGNPVLAGTCSNLLGNVGRNSVYGPGLVNVDFSVFKDNYIRKISETFNLQFRAEFFNVFNHPNFQAPIDNSTLFNGDGSSTGGAGLIDATSSDSRQIQFALKVIF